MDGIAAMLIQNLNAYIATMRDEIAARYNLPENDRNARLMEIAQVKEDNYFRHIVHEDIDSIIRDIKEVHKFDSESAPDSTMVDEVKKGLDAAVNFEGSPQEKQIAGFCRQLGINYKKLTAEEFQVMIQVLQKSPLLKTPIRLRGKKKKRK